LGDADDGAAEYLYAICPSGAAWTACFADAPVVDHTFNGPASQQQKGTLTLSFFNDTGDYERLIYGANFHTEGGMSVAPVPEPASLSLFSLGLGLIGLGAMRRRKDRRET
jgi:hypothetical protein